LASVLNVRSVFAGETDPSVVVRSGQSEASIDVFASDWEFGGSLRIDPYAKNLPYPLRLTVEGHRVDWQPNLPDSGIPEKSPWQKPLGTRAVRQFSQNFPKAFLLRMEPRLLAGVVLLETDSTLKEDGRNLASVVSVMLLQDPETLGRVVEDLRRIVPHVVGLRVRLVQFRATSSDPSSVNEVRQELLVDFQNAKGVPAHAVSEGTLLLIGLLAVLHGPSRPKMLLLDDLDRGLHPKAQRELIGILRGLLESNPDLQIVATSHSPYLVDELEASEVWVCALDAEGISHVRNLATHPRADTLLDVLTTGELLSAEGDDWVLAGDP
jgi:hypothetical protein